ncbi:MAG: acyl-CoA dehydrogenase family protein [Deferrisomatales bacterium]
MVPAAAPSNDDAALRGGSFLFRDAAPGEVFTPEEFTSDQRMAAKTARDFMEQEVVPASARLEAGDRHLLVGLLRRAGELGLFMADVPESLGGLDLDKASSALIVESLSGQASFQISAIVQVGIGSLPLIYYGNDDQQRRYLPGLADGTLLGCYALTEPTAGSDALACRTRAVLSADGTHYRLTGTKQFITSARIADVLTVFAKVDGERFTAFLVDRGAPGLSFGVDEHKMGLHGSTTCSVLLDEVPVPVGNLLGAVGGGHKIAFNILNIGRFKLGAVAVGIAKRALEHALAYTLERRQFGRPIAEFGAVREKLGQMFARTYAAEAATYRTVGLIDALLAQGAGEGREASLRSIEEFSVECAMVKVLATEALDYVADEAVQCLGGYGYCSEYPVEGLYRDSRINRIYEGTNEINRLLVPTMLLRRAASGALPLPQAFDALSPLPEAAEGPLAAEARLVAALKRACLGVLARAAEAHGPGLAGQQAVQLRIADLAILAYTAESAWLRAAKDLARRGDGAALALAAARITCEEAAERAEALARQALVHLGARDALAPLAELFRREPADTLALREAVAARLVELERVPL